MYVSSVSLYAPPSPFWNDTVAEFETVRVYVAVRVNVPFEPASVIAYVPVGVFGDVVMVVVDRQVGMHVCGVNVQVLPLGRPEQENPTGCEAPERSVAVTTGTADPPGETDPEEGFTETEKSNIWGPDGGLNVTVSFGALADSLES